MVNRALSHFERETGLEPRVILVPKRMFDVYLAERAAIDAVLPEVGGGGQGWVDVRMVESDRGAVEVY